MSAGFGMLASSRFVGAQERKFLHKKIPSSGEQIPAIGMGTSITFNIGNDSVALAQRADVLRAFFEMGGGLIDSSPMYGSSEAVIGRLLQQLNSQPALFSATKVWTSSGRDGPEEINASRELWGIPRFDLLQVHNLLTWQDHLKTLFAMKERGELRYVGITTSHGRRHGDLEQIMREWPIDFIQASYNIVDRELEARILPLAAERGIAVIANRPFRRGGLIDHVKRHPLPEWAKEIDCHNWPAFLLKFIVTHPAVTCAIPATSRADHMRENMGAMLGEMPDAATRSLMIEYVKAL
jgi:diketogulonate reductase-like aldo/keto reductase